MEVPRGAGAGEAIFFFSMFCWGALLVSTFLGVAGECPFSKSLSGDGELSLLLLEPRLLSDESESGKVTVLFWFFLFSNCKVENDLTFKRFNASSMQVPF